ncbi:MAG: hypothetical protein ACLQVX_21985 [Limisphaerales bacterium]
MKHYEMNTRDTKQSATEIIAAGAKAELWSKLKMLLWVVGGVFVLLMVIALISAGLGALTSGVSPQALKRLGDPAKVEGDTVKLTLDCDNWGQKMLVQKICDTIVDLGHNYSECKKYELVVRVSGLNGYGKSVVTEANLSGDDLDEIRKYENGGYYATVASGWIAMKLRNAHINMAE